ncbi:MAG TPA: hypothetical protein VHO03_06040 [Ignavibacteriales bacterium]|nr:hypothetical protein [Ignavibacteriales bacterium]
MNNKVILKFEEYLKDSLGLSVKAEKWRGGNSLPFFLLDIYDMYQVNILDRPFILIQPKNEEELTPAEVRHHFKLIQEKSGQEAILVRASIASFNRQRLISHKVPFVVPENQVYLPDLGIDLQEHFRAIRSTPEYLSPSAQLLLLFILIHRIKTPKSAGEYARILGYANMTMTRAFDELEASGLVEISKSGKERILHQYRDWKELWEMAVPYLRSPVKNEIYVKQASENLYHHCYKADLTALTEYTMISPPKTNVFALGTEDYRYLYKNNELEIIEYPEEAIAKLQEWKYSPKFLANEKTKTVDRFSLYLSFKNEEDERVNSALKELIRGDQW